MGEISNKFLASVAAFCILATSALAQSNVVTFTDQEIAGLMASVCGPQAVSGKLHLHRNAAGNMLYIISPGKFESLVYAQQQSCNPLAPETLDLWRNMHDGAVSAQLANRFDTERLLVGGNSDGISGKSFDVEPGGNYLLVSHPGNVSSVSPVDRPYVRTIELHMDAKRVFLRQGGLIVVGNNPTTNQLEAVPVSLQGGSATAGAPIVVPGVPAGVSVLDYNEKSDELLLGGIGAGGSTSFAIANLSNGQARLVDNVKPGATTALFINDPGLLARLSGQAVPSGAGSGSVQQPGQTQPRKRGFLGGLFGRN